MRQAARKMEYKDQSADELVIKYQKYAHSIAAKLIASMHLPATQLDEFVSAGYLGLVEAAQRFDGSSGIDFRNFAFLRIKGAIIDSIRASSDLSGKAYRMARAWSASQSLEESYFVGGVEHVAHGDEKALAEIFEFAASGALAFKLSMDDVEEEVADLVSHDVSQEVQMIEQQESASLKKLVLELPEKERIVIWGYYFENKTFSQIELENDGMTKSWISRLHARALIHLRELFIERGGDPREAL